MTKTTTLDEAIFDKYILPIQRPLMAPEAFHVGLISPAQALHIL